MHVINALTRGQSLKILSSMLLLLPPPRRLCFRRR